MEERKIVVIGGGGVGKSAMTIRFLQNFFVTDYDPTIEETYRKQITVDSKTVLLDVLDTAGQEEYSAMREQYMESGDGFLIVYSMVDNASFEEIPELYQLVLRVKDAEKFPCVICSNKCDLESGREVSANEGKNVAKSCGVPFFETSAKTMKNIENCFHDLVREIRKSEKPSKPKKKFQLRCEPELIEGPNVVSSTTDPIQKSPSVTQLINSGDWVVSWDDNRDGDMIYGQRYSTVGTALGLDGTGGDIMDFNLSLSKESCCSKLGQLVDGGWVVAYVVNQSNSQDIAFQRFSQSGEILIGETIANDDANGYHSSPDIQGLNNGGWAIIWTDFRNDDKYSDIYGQVFDSSGVTVGENFIVNDQSIQEIRRNAKLSSHLDDSLSSFVVFWEDWRLGYSKIFGQLFNGGDASTNGDNFELTPSKLQAQFEIDISPLLNEEMQYVVVWSSFQNLNQMDLWYIIISNDGSKIDGKEESSFVEQIDGLRDNQITPSVTGIYDGGFLIVWDDDREQIDNSIYSVMYNKEQQIIGEEFLISNSEFKSEADPVTLYSDADNLVFYLWFGSSSTADNEGVFYSLYNISLSYPVLNIPLADQYGKSAYDQFSYQIPFDSFTCSDEIITYQSQLSDNEDLPDWLEFNSDSDNRTFHGTPVGCSDDLNVKVIAECCSNKIYDEFYLQVENREVDINESIPEYRIAMGNLLDYYLPPDSFANNEKNEELVYSVSIYNDEYEWPDWLNWLSNEKKFVGLVTEKCRRTYPILVAVNDTCESNTAQSQIFNLTITNNDPYLNKTIEDQYYPINQEFEFIFDQDTFANDEDIEKLTYQAQLINGDPLPDWINFDSNGRKFYGVSPNQCDLQLQIKVIATDECSTNENAMTNFTWTFEYIDPKVLNDPPDQNYNVSTEFSFNIPDDTFNNTELISNLTYQAILSNGDPLPQWLNFDQSEGTFSGVTPDGCQIDNEYIINITILYNYCQTNDSSDGDADDEEKSIAQFKFTVYNNAITLLSPIGDRDYSIGETINFQIDEQDYISHIDKNEQLDYTVSLINGDPLPEWIAFNYDESEKILKFQGNAPIGCSINLNVKMQINDSCYTITDLFEMDVINQAPTNLKSISKFSYYIGEDFQYAFPEDLFSNQEDVNLETLTYQLKLYDEDTNQYQDLPSWLNFYPDQVKMNGTIPKQCPETHQLALIATDSCADEDHRAESPFLFEIQNESPININPIPYRSFQVGDLMSFVIPENTFINVEENEDLTYQAQLINDEPLPDWLAFDPDERKFSGEAPFGCPIIYQINVTASDSCFSAHTIFNIEITNEPPSTTYDLQDKFYEISTSFFFEIQYLYSDIDRHEILDYEFFQQNGDPSPDWIFFNDNRLFFFGETHEGCTRDWYFSLRVQDTCYTEYSNFTFTVNNTEPIVRVPLADQEFEAGQYFEYTIPEPSIENYETQEQLDFNAVTTDDEGGEQPLPSWLNFDSDGREFSGTIPEICAKDFDIKVIINDSCFTIFDIFNFKILNEAPLLNANETIDRQQVINGEYFEYIFPENLFLNEEYFETLDYSSELINGEDLPDWLAFDPDERKFNGNSPEGCSIEYEIVILVNDSCATTNTSFMLDVINEPPIKNGSIGKLKFERNATFEYVFPLGLFINNDLDETLVYTSKLSNGENLPDWITFDPDERKYSGSAPDICGLILQIELNATDSCSIVNEIFIIQIGQDPPLLKTPLEDRTILFDEIIDFTFPEDAFISSNDTADDDDLSYDAKLSNGESLPDWLAFDPLERRFVGHSPDCAEILYITVNCSDSCYSIYDEFELEIQNDPPMLINPIGDQTFEQNIDIVFVFPNDTFQNNESSKQELTYDAKLSNGEPLPDWLNFDPLERKFSGKTPDGCGFVLNIFLNASDNCDWGYDEFKFTINNNQLYQNKSIPDQYQYQVNETFNFLIANGTFINHDADEETTYQITLYNGDPLPEWVQYVINDYDEISFFGQAPLQCSFDTEILITVSDSCNSIQDQFTIEITNSKLEQQMDLSNQQSEVGEAFEYIFREGTFLNEDQFEDIYYEATLTNDDPLPDWLKFNPSERKFHGQAPLQCGDIWEIKLIAQDNCTQLETSFYFTINNNPISKNKSLTDQQSVIGEYFEYIFDEDTFLNEDQFENIYYEATLTNDDPLPDWLKFNPSERKFNGTMAFGCQEEFDIKLIISDNCSNIIDSFKFTKLNTKPTINQTLESYKYSIGVDFQFQISDNSFSNEEIHEDLQYGAKLYNGDQDLPDWLNFDSQNLIFNGTTPMGCQQNLLIKLSGEDSCSSESQLFYLNITNEPPIIKDQLEDQTYQGGDSIDINYPEDTFTNTEDQSIETLTYEALLSNGDSLPGWLNFYPDEFKFNGTADSCGDNYQIDLIGKDSCYEIKNTFNIEIVNEPLVLLNAIEDRYFDIDEKINFTIPKETLFSNDEINEELSFKVTLYNGDPVPDWLTVDAEELSFIGYNDQLCNTDNLHIKIEISDYCTTIKDDFELIFNNGVPVLNNSIPNYYYNTLDTIDFIIPEDTFDNPEDPSAETLTYEARLSNGDPLPSWLTFLPNEERFVGVAPDGCSSMHEIQIIVQDNCNEITENFWLFIENHPILINENLEEYSIHIGETLNLNIENIFKNEDLNEPLTYSSTLANGKDFPSWLHFDENLKTYYGNMPIGCSQTISIRLFANDTCYLWNTYHDWQLKVVNDVPEANNTIEDREYYLLEDFEFYINEDSFINQEAQFETLTYEAFLFENDNDAPLPDWVTFDANAKQFSGIYDEGCDEDLNIKIQVTDSCDSNAISQFFHLKITNIAPQIDEIISDHTFTSNEPFNFNFTQQSLFINPDANENVYYYTQLSNGGELPSWLNFDSTELKFYGRIPVTCPETYQIDLIITDSCQNNVNYQTFNLVIENDPPVVNRKIENFEIHSSNDFVFYLHNDSFINPDPYEELEYDPRIDGNQLLPDWIRYDDDQNSFMGTAPQGCDQTLNITIYSGDPCYYEYTSQWFLLSILNEKPERNQLIPDQTIHINQELAYQIPQNSFYDDEGFENLNFKAELSNNEPLPDWLNLDENTGVLYGTVPNVCTQTLSIHVFAFDTCGLQYAENYLNLTILNENVILQSPIQNYSVSVTQDFEFYIPENTFLQTEITEQLVYSDPKIILSNNDDGDDQLTYQDLPSWIAFDIDQNMARFSGTAPSDQCNDYLNIYIEVNEDSCGSNTLNTNFFLNIINDPPVVNKKINDQFINLDEDWVFQFDIDTFTNSENDENIYYLAFAKNKNQLPDWLSFDPENRKFSGTTPDDVQSVEIELYCYDSCESNAIMLPFKLNIQEDSGKNTFYLSLIIPFAILSLCIILSMILFLFYRKNKRKEEEQEMANNFNTTENSNLSSNAEENENSSDDENEDQSNDSDSDSDSDKSSGFENVSDREFQNVEQL
ncbi:ras-like protein rasb [Anaeramoeba flamelloides]|uniref:Ras-like protein rasb n=1 Tax=Anaeramoeba flamelloides TaxID=1746091 RepID=A0AAV8ABC0_9EUKA|nr:ras-like protein rasb [Anaeramoeba flamelloides]